MFVKEYFAVCDVCRTRFLLPWCNSISTSSVSRLRKLYHWLVCRNGRFVCTDCQKKPIFPIDWSKYD